MMGWVSEACKAEQLWRESLAWFMAERFLSCAANKALGFEIESCSDSYHESAGSLGDFSEP